MLGCVDRVIESRQYSTGDYCESPDSSHRRGEHQHNEYTSPSTRHRTPALPRCMRKQYRWSAACCYQPRSIHSFPNRKTQRSGGRRLKRFHQLEETTSMDEHKSMTSYSSILTVDVSREMEAVNRDIEEIIRRCDDYCPEGPVTLCKHCCRSRRQRKCCKVGRNLTEEQARIMPLKRIPMDKLKEVPIALLKPRPPRQFKEKSHSVPHTKPKTSRDIRNIVEETDALLRNVYRELSRGKTHDEENCRCVDTQIWGPTCLERYLGCQSKCRRMHENRWFRPKWKDVFDKPELYKMIKPNNERTKHFHDTNCISEPTTSSCLIKNKKDTQEVSKPKLLRDAEVNTEPVSIGPLNFKSKQSISDLNDDLYQPEDPFKEKKYPVDLESAKHFVNYPSDDLSGRSSRFKNPTSEPRKPKAEDFESAKDDTSLLLDRNMGLTLDKASNLKANEVKEDFAERGTVVSNKVSEPIYKSHDTYLSNDYFGGTPRSGAGDSVSAVENSKVFISQIINKIVNKPIDFTSPIISQSVDIGNLEKTEVESEELDTGMCLEIMRRLVDLMSKHHRKQIDFFRDVPGQYARVRKMKQQHLINIDKEINSILDLEFYLRNASPARN